MGVFSFLLIVRDAPSRKILLAELMESQEKHHQLSILMGFLLPPGALSGGFLGEKASGEEVPRCTECQN